MLAAGYLLIRRVPRPVYVSAELVPSGVVSASDCICPQFPGPYAIDWSSMSADQRESDFEEIGVRTEQRQAALEWGTSAIDSEFGWPGVFLTLAAARNALSRFFMAAPDIRLIGLGLPDAVVESFITEATPPPPRAGFATQGECGYLTVATQGEAAPVGGVQLGYELLDLEHGQLAHSWLCNGLERHCADVLGVTPGRYRLIESLDDALRCCTEIRREEVGAEPGYWLPVALIDYTGSGRRGDVERDIAMTRKLWMFVLMFSSLPLVAAQRHSCSLDSAVVAPYRQPNATDEAWASSRRALFDFMGCDPKVVDAKSRRIFFEVVAREFTTDHRASINRWAAAHPDGNPDGMFETVNRLQYGLRESMDRLFDPRTDAEFKDTVVRYGKGKTIARVGPGGKADVKKSLGAPSRFYGVANLHNSQLEALHALGYWLEPGNVSFTPAEKYEFTQILTGLLDVSENVAGAHHARLIKAALRSLARSDDSHAIVRLEQWAEKRARKDDEIAKLAAKTIQAMKTNGRK